MKRLEQLVSALTPKRWPVRWRLAAVSAVLTFVILVIFALVVGRLTSNRLQADFNSDLTRYAANLGHQNQFGFQALSGSPTALHNMALPSDARLRITDAHGTAPAPPGPPTLGPPRRGVPHIDDLAVASAPLDVPAASAPPLFFQSARPTNNVDSTTDRL